MFATNNKGHAEAIKTLICHDRLLFPAQANLAFVRLQKRLCSAVYDLNILAKQVLVLDKQQNIHVETPSPLIPAAREELPHLQARS